MTFEGTTFLAKAKKENKFTVPDVDPGEGKLIPVYIKSNGREAKTDDINGKKIKFIHANIQPGSGPPQDYRVEADAIIEIPWFLAQHFKALIEAE